MDIPRHTGKDTVLRFSAVFNFDLQRKCEARQKLYKVMIANHLGPLNSKVKLLSALKALDWIEPYSLEADCAGMQIDKADCFDDGIHHWENDDLITRDKPAYIKYERQAVYYFGECMKSLNGGSPLNWLKTLRFLLQV